MDCVLTKVDPFNGSRRPRANAHSQESRTRTAIRQANQRGSQRFFEIGERIGPHTFDGYVGDNATGLYVYLLTGCCGKRISYRRAILKALHDVKCCSDCHKARKKASCGK